MNKKLEGRRGAPCWEEDCNDPITHHLIGPVHEHYISGLGMVKLQATTWACSRHAIEQSIQDPRLTVIEVKE